MSKMNNFNVRFWSNTTPKRSIVIRFSSVVSADKFIEAWQNIGGVRHFEADLLGEGKIDTIPSDVEETYLFGKNNVATARVLNRALWR